MATSCADERLLSAFGLSVSAPVQHESCQALPGGGVLFLLPFLLECGLLSYRKHYAQRKGYYSFNSLFIIIAFCFLCRIKSFEQVKNYAPGEFGRLVGYDRIPEVRTIRYMVKEITAQKCADKWVVDLSGSWIDGNEPEFYYIDGHVQVYHGCLDQLGKKHVSRQRLCLPGMMEFWVNTADGAPYFFVTSQVNEKMIEMMKSDIIPRLKELHPVSPVMKAWMEDCPHVPLFTLVFDREAWSPDFFAWLWDTHRIAVITYRKYVKDQWDKSLFREYPVATSMGEVKMKLHEKDVLDAKCLMREVRKPGNEDHQTSIITTNPMIRIEVVASQMFARWATENYFRFMRQDYNIDRIIQYSIDEINTDVEVVNREYSNITYELKKERSKLYYREAKLLQYQEQNPLLEEDENENKKLMMKKLELMEDIQKVQKIINELINKRKGVPYKIKLSDMPEATRYNRLNRESKTLMNVIKMICYRAETALASRLSPHYKRAGQEIRTLIKSIINTTIDMEVDQDNEILIITLYPLANQRSNEAVSKICELLNDTKTIYPDTNLKLFYKITTV